MRMLHTAIVLLASMSVATAQDQLEAEKGPERQPVTLQDGRENPAVNRLGLSPEILARERAGCEIIEDRDVIASRGNTSFSLWPNRIVPYAFDANVGPSQRQAAIEAIQAIEAVCGVDLRARTNEPDYVVFTDSDRNSSHVGPIGGGQVINIYNWNFVYIIAHEIMHAMGYYHEHQRPDRNTFVNIDYGAFGGPCDSNCETSGCQDANFGIRGTALGPYDYDSVMHYGAFDFGCGSMVISTLTPPPGEAYYDDPTIFMGQRFQLSVGDEESLVENYGPRFSLPVDIHVRFNAPGPHDGSFERPYPTLEQAATNAAPGDTIGIIGGGMSTESDLIINKDLVVISSGNAVIQ